MQKDHYSSRDMTRSTWQCVALIFFSGWIALPFLSATHGSATHRLSSPFSRNQHAITRIRKDRPHRLDSLKTLQLLQAATRHRRAEWSSVDRAHHGVAIRKVGLSDLNADTGLTAESVDVQRQTGYSARC
jgi:hypothetical protein